MTLTGMMLTAQMMKVCVQIVVAKAVLLAWVRTWPGDVVVVKGAVGAICRHRALCKKPYNISVVNYQ
jgi:hypothetical protein